MRERGGERIEMNDRNNNTRPLQIMLNAHGAWLLLDSQLAHNAITHQSSMRNKCHALFTQKHIQTPGDICNLE